MEPTVRSEPYPKHIQFPTEFLNGVENSGLPQHELHLKKSAVIILLRNLSARKGRCNGTRHRIIDAASRLVSAQRLDAEEDEEIVLIPKINARTRDGEWPFVMKRLQFPVRLAYGITFNRSQGQSLDRCGTTLPASAWTHGQLCVGLSRCGDKRSARACANQDEFRQLGLPENAACTRNAACPEALIN